MAVTRIGPSIITMTEEDDAITDTVRVLYIRIVATAGTSGQLVTLTNTAGGLIAKSVLTANAPFIDHIPIQQWVEGITLSDLDPTATVFIYLDPDGKP